VVVNALLWVVFAVFFIRGSYGQTQTFSSGSTGADGALNLTTPGTIIFNPKAFSPPLNPAGDNVFNFTTINIAKGVTLKLSSAYLNGPVYWLAQGTVTINGTIDLGGANGQDLSNVTSLRVPAAGGPGGYNGGVGGNNGGPLPFTPQPGNGPGGGASASGCCAQGSTQGKNGSFTGNPYLIPLIGGSGGGGGETFWNALGNASPSFAGGGGGGGGAILIASSASITYSGVISANGGSGGGDRGLTTSPCGAGCGGSGGGGAIRLVAPVISQTTGGDGPCLNGGVGTLYAAVYRIEAFTFNPTFGGGCENVKTSTPISVAAPSTPPSSLKVVSLVTSSGTIPINANPFSFPDAVINSSGPITVNVQAQYIPLGTIPNIIVLSEGASDQSVACSAGLQGTLPQSTCRASITFPTGGSRGFVKATWQ